MSAISLRPHRTWSALLLADGFFSFSQTMHPASTPAIPSTAVPSHFLLQRERLRTLDQGSACSRVQQDALYRSPLVITLSHGPL